MRIGADGEMFVMDVLEGPGEAETVIRGQWADPILERVNQIRANSDRGFFKDKERSWQMYASIPIVLWRKEWDGDSKALQRWIETDPVGQQYRISPKDTGNSGKVIVK